MKGGHGQTKYQLHVYIHVIPIYLREIVVHSTINAYHINNFTVP